MNVVFVVTNSILGKKKQDRKDIDYRTNDLSSNNEWITNNDWNASYNEGLDEIENLDMNVPMDDNFINVQAIEDDIGGSGASLDIDDLEMDGDENQLDVGNEDDGLGSDRDICKMKIMMILAFNELL